MRILLFDLDWTLIYTGGAGVRALDFAFEKLFKTPQAMKKVTPDGKTDPAICREMIRVHLSREPQGDEIEKLCRGYLDRLAGEIPNGPGYRILPGIPELLTALSQRNDVLMGLGTGNLEEGARTKLARADLMKYFQFGGYGSDSEDRPTVLRTGVKRGEVIAQKSFSPRDVVIIGDNIRDVQAGQAIGATTVEFLQEELCTMRLPSYPEIRQAELELMKIIHEEHLDESLSSAPPARSLPQ